jgi:hypothetical protein
MLKDGASQTSKIIDGGDLVACFLGGWDGGGFGDLLIIYVDDVYMVIMVDMVIYVYLVDDVST